MRLYHPVMIEPRDAFARIEPYLSPLPAVRRGRREALGQVLAEPLVATTAVPAHDVSAMDGYCLAGEVEPGEIRPVSGTIAAGDPPGAEVPSGSAARIMTGAPVPGSADRVVPVELTDNGDERVTFERSTAAGAHIRRSGEVLVPGTPLLAEGAVLHPPALSLLASQGIEELPVHAQPRVRLLVTGDEVVPPAREPAPGQLRDSHTDFLTAASRQIGIELEPLGIARDDRADLARHIERGLEADVFLLTGGVSKGEYDYVEDVLADFGCQFLFDAVAVQPGKPLVVGHHEDGLIFGLPGNPASVMVSFWLFVRPALRRLAGHHDGYWYGAQRATLAGPLPGAKGRDRFFTGTMTFGEAGDLRVTPHTAKGSHDLSAYGQGACLVRVPRHDPPREPGAQVELLAL